MNVPSYLQTWVAIDYLMSMLRETRAKMQRFPSEEPVEIFGSNIDFRRMEIEILMTLAESGILN